MLSRRVPRGLSRKLFIASSASLMAPMTGSIGEWLLCSTDEGACWSGRHNQGAPSCEAAVNWSERHAKSEVFET
jgi:hypothetical protein